MDVVKDFQGELSGLELKSIAIIDSKTVLAASHEFIYTYRSSEKVEQVVKREDLNSKYRMTKICFVKTLKVLTPIGAHALLACYLTVDGELFIWSIDNSLCQVVQKSVKLIGDNH